MRHSPNTFMVGAAAGLAVGLLANVARKGLVQAPTMLAGNWADALAAEHRATVKLFDTLQATQDDQTRRRAMMLMQLKHMIARHALEEENAIYPALRQHGLAEPSDTLSQEHALVKYFLFRLTVMDKDDATWLSTLGELRSAIVSHMREEEDEIFPRLRERLGDEGNRQLTLQMNREGIKLA